MTTVDLYVLVIVLAEYAVLQIGSASCSESAVHFFHPSLYAVRVWRSARGRGSPSGWAHRALCRTCLTEYAVGTAGRFGILLRDHYSFFRPISSRCQGLAFRAGLCSPSGWACGVCRACSATPAQSAGRNASPPPDTCHEQSLPWVDLFRKSWWGKMAHCLDVLTH